jgi:AcrR family transcriptional regulator
VTAKLTLTDDKQTAILEATLELVAARGFHGTPMSQVAKKSGVAVGTIYQYFPGKEDLISTLYLEVKRRLAQATRAVYSPEDPVHEGFLEIFGTVVRYCVAHPRELSFAEQCENSPLITPEAKAEGLSLAEPVQAFFRRARVENLVKSLPDEVLGAIVAGAVISLAKLHLAAGSPVSDEALAAELEAVWDAIKA